MAKTREDRRQFWREHVHAWRHSGERRDDYCREHGLNVQTFNLWVGRLRDELRPLSCGDGGGRTTGTTSPETSDAPTFIPVEVATDDETPTHGSQPSTRTIEIDAGGVTFRVGVDADTEMLARIITAARRAT
jgi:hypothetical protein